MSGISLDEFKARLPLAEIVGKYVKLTRHGRELKGLCPFHKEKTPSFGVVEDKGFYHCFGCGAHGNAIDFVMAHDRLEFGEAIKAIAEMTGIEAPALRQEREQKPEHKGIADANAAAVAWFAERLRGEEGAGARRYLSGRQLRDDDIETFRLGYAPDNRQALKTALISQGYAQDLLIEAGLVSKLDDGAVIDRFRDRLMFPISDEKGRPVGFGGRALGDAKAKYLNTSDTPVFKKGEQLYGLNLTASEARRQNAIHVVEGYMDVIAFHRAGIGLAVAPLGTAVTEDQIAKLWRYADEPIFCFDGDEAGRRAAVRAARRALPILKPGKSLQFVLLPAGEDPDSLVTGGGPSALMEAIARPSSMLDQLFRAEIAANPCDTPERRAKLKRQLNMLAASIEDGELRSLYQAMFRERMDALWRPRQFRPGRNKGRRRPARVSQLSARDQALDSVRRRSELDLLRPIIDNPSIFFDIESELEEIPFRTSDVRALKAEILEFFASVQDDDGVEVERLRDHLSQHVRGEILDEIKSSRIGGWAVPVGVRNDSPIDQWRSSVARWQHSERRRSESAALGDDLLGSDASRANARLESIRQLLDGEGQSED